jgi:hypothetical protein
MEVVMKLKLFMKEAKEVGKSCTKNKENGYEPIQVVAAVGLGVIVLASLLFYFGKGMNVFKTAKEMEIDNGQTASEILDDPASILSGDN